MNKTVKKTATGILLFLVILGIFCGIAGATGEAEIHYITNEIQPGDTLTISGYVSGDSKYGSDSYYILIIGDDYWWYKYYAPNQTENGNFVAKINDLGNLPAGQYYAIVVTASDDYYEVYPEESYLYYNGTAVENLNNLKGLAGVKTVIEYLGKNNVNDTYSAGDFWVVNSANQTPAAKDDVNTGDSSSNLGIIIGIIGGVVALVILAGIIVYVVHKRNSRGKQAEENTSLKKETIALENTVIQEDTVPESKEIGYSYCPYCGEKLEKDAKFCVKCGNKIHK